MDADGVNQLIRDNVGLLTLLTFFLGLALGNRLAIGRDKRKELNEAVKPIRAWLLSQADSPSPYMKVPPAEKIDLFANCLSFWKKKEFLKCWANQEELRRRSQTQDPLGQVFYRNEEDICEAVKKCIPYTKRM